MSLALFNSVCEIEVIVDENGNPWFKRAHVGKFLNLEDIRTSTRDLASEDQNTRTSLAARHTMPGQFKGQDHNNFLSVYGVMYAIINSRKERGKELKEWILKDIIPRGLKDKMIEMKEEHRQAIEEKEAALALLNDELQAIQFENVGLQGEIKAKDKTIQDLIDNRHVPRRGEYDNILVVFQKNKPVEDGIRKSRHAFYMIRCQYRALTNHKKWLKSVIQT